MRTSAIAALSLFASSAGLAQNTGKDTTALYKGWLGGFAVGIPGFAAQPIPEAFTVAVFFTDVRPNRVGADIWIGTMPRAFSEAAVLGGRLNAALSLPLSPELVLLPTGGLSLVGALYDGSGGGIFGYNLGASAAFLGEGSGLRASVTVHRLGAGTGPIWLLELGVITPRR
jgi:hypothetical protein